MKIILLNQHEAVVIDDGRKTVTVEPEANGDLVVNGSKFPVTVGGEAPDLGDKKHVNAVFMTTSGVVYRILAPSVYKGVLTTRFDPYTYAVESRLHIDRLEKELEKTREELRALKGSIKYDALGYLIN